MQLSVRFQDADKQGQQAGMLETLDTRMAIEVANDIQYLGQTEAGTEIVTPDTAIWHFRWQAPQSTGNVVFHLAANAANGDESELGDHIYIQTIEVAGGGKAR